MPISRTLSLADPVGAPDAEQVTFDDATHAPGAALDTLASHPFAVFGRQLARSRPTPCGLAPAGRRLALACSLAPASRRLPAFAIGGAIVGATPRAVVPATRRARARQGLAVQAIAVGIARVSRLLGLRLVAVVSADGGTG